MSTTTSQPEVAPLAARMTATQWGATLEVLLMYAGILLYIWRWHFAYPHLWMLFFALVLASHVVHRDRLRDLGLTLNGTRASAGTILPLAAALFVPVILAGLALGRLSLIAPGTRTVESFVGYLLWCAFQQYVTQSYFHHRLLSIIPNRNTTSIIVALLFGGAHIPNPILMVATTLGGFVLAEVFARHRSIWPLALAQAAGGFLIAAMSPASLIHNMRVGPGYYFHGLR